MRVPAQRQTRPQEHVLSARARSDKEALGPHHRIDPDPVLLQCPPAHWRGDFSRIPVQAKLVVHQPGDQYEQEADRVADRVMRMPDPGAAASPAVSGAASSVQRKCACGGSCDRCREEEGQKHEQVQRKLAGSGDLGQAEAPPVVQEALRSPGLPLDRGTRGYFEPRFRHDFSKVRVHAGEQADAAARSLGARAFTVGRDVVFADGEFATGSERGRSLLAHELTHVVQQSRESGLRGAAIQRACLSESECAVPQGQARPGSAKQFVQQQNTQGAPLKAAKRGQTPAAAQAGGHGQRAVEVERIFQQHLPDLKALNHGVFIDDTIPANASAYSQDCLKWANESLPAGADKTPFQGAAHSCIFIPKDLEDKAAKFNATVKQMGHPTKKQEDDLRPILDWYFLRVLTHEVTHERANQAKIQFPADQGCTREALLPEISELAAAISEFPLVEGLDYDLREAWAKNYLTDPRQLADPGESIVGAIREIRCACECAGADSLIRQAYAIASALWTDDQKASFQEYMKGGRGSEFGVYWPFDFREHRHRSHAPPKRVSE